MIIFKLLNKLYTSPDPKWIKDLDDNMIQPILINKWLSMNPNMLKVAAWLDKYTFTIQPKMWLAMAWSVIPKQSKAPYVKYIKKIKTEDDMQFLIDKIRKYLEMSDNDYASAKPYILNYIEKNKLSLFTQFGIEKRLWKKHGLDFKDIKSGGKREGKMGPVGLELWGL